MNKKLKYIIILILSAIAFVNASYLTYRAFELKNQSTETISSNLGFCDINNTFSCSNVLTATEVQIFDIPFPAIAMIVYPVLFLVAILGYIGKIKTAFPALLGLSAGGIAFNGYIIFQEAMYVGSYCILCLFCTAIILTIFFFSLSEVKMRPINV